jgi:molybdopterin converting factor small subunit
MDSTDEETDSQPAATAEETDSRTETTVEVRLTGHVRTAVGTGSLAFSFQGATLREFLAAFFDEYDVREMLIAETDADARHRGWARPPDDLPGTWRKNPEGENTRVFARVTVNGRFNEHLDGFETVLEDGDRVGLLYPFMFCL